MALGTISCFRVILGMVKDFLLDDLKSVSAVYTESMSTT